MVVVFSPVSLTLSDGRDFGFIAYQRISFDTNPLGSITSLDVRGQKRARLAAEYILSECGVS